MYLVVAHYFQVQQISALVLNYLSLSLSGLCRALCDTNDCGKLSKEQFALAFHFINQKLTKGIDPPKVLTADMIPPSERTTVQKVKLK